MNTPKSADVISHISEYSRNIEGEYFTFPTETKTTQQPKLLYGGIEKIPANLDVVNANVKHLGFEYIISGKCLLTFKGKVFELGPGSILSLNESDQYQFKLQGKSPLIRAYFGFTNQDSSNSIDEQQFLRSPNPFKLNNIKWMRQTIQQIIDCAQVNDPASEELCSMLMAYFIKRVNIEKTSTPKTTTHASATFERVRSFIENNYLEIKRINEVSKACYISLPHLSRLFKEFSIEKPSQMLNRLKLEKAAEMLTSGNYLIKEVADYIGYDDALYFSNRFKLYFGVSPKYYSESKLTEFPNDIRKAS